MRGLSARLSYGLLSALLVLAIVPAGWSGEQAAKKKILYFTKSCGFEHSVVARKGGEPAYSEKIMVELGKKLGYEIVCSKDGSLLEPDKIDQWDGFIFYATGDLTQPSKSDPAPPMSAAGKKALLGAIRAGKGFAAIHAGNDAFRLGEKGVDPFIRMLGAEFASHGKQQEALIRVTDPDFPGMEGVKDFKLLDEWYTNRNVAPDLHVILVLDTKGMEGAPYEREPLPAAWARRQGKGRVYYNALGHREDVWDNPMFQQMLIGGLRWAFGEVEAKAPANLKEASPLDPKWMAPVPEKGAGGKKKGGKKAAAEK